MTATRLALRTAALLPLAATLLGGGCGGPDGAPGGDAGAGEPRPAATATLPVDLHFPGAGGYLYKERRELPRAERPEEQVRIVVEALLSGPESPELVPPFRAEVSLDFVSLSMEGTAYVGLAAPEGGGPPPSGSAAELQRIYSVVNTVVFNVPEARRVVLLWNGSQPTSLAGHVDTSRPLSPETGMVARR